jgi:aspartyl-tRNA(Asn)/glutamyl-tRNA(Gln) amidotransferase subunit C
MSITIDNVKQVAHLARIKMSDEELARFQNSLNGILDFVEQLNQVDCSNMDNTVQYTSQLYERADVAVKCDSAVMDNAPQKACNMFVVPKMM